MPSLYCNFLLGNVELDHAAVLIGAFTFSGRERLVCLGTMSAHEIDDYLKGLDEPARSTLRQLRETILQVVPDADQCISYSVPAFRMHGKVVAGFAAFKTHLSYLPHSGSVLSQLSDEVEGHGGTKSALHFPLDQSIPPALVEKLIAVRLREILDGSQRHARNRSPYSK
ncbi:MAG: iron chaperone [Chloroflexota bacterium]